jgi:hypothetical protein
MYLPAVSMPQRESSWHHIQVFDVLEAVAQIAQEGVVEVLEHASLADDIADAFGSYDCYTASASSCGAVSCCDGAALTFIFPDVLEGKGESGVLALDDAHFAKGALADDAQQAKVVEIHWGHGQRTAVERAWLPRPCRHMAWHGMAWRGGRSGMRRTLVGEDDGLPIALTHGELQWRWPRKEKKVQGGLGMHVRVGCDAGQAGWQAVRGRGLRRAASWGLQADSGSAARRGDVGIGGLVWVSGWSCTEAEA